MQPGQEGFNTERRRGREVRLFAINYGGHSAAFSPDLAQFAVLHKRI